MLFFQAGLLAGYAYAHLVTTRLSIRQATVHAAVVVPLALLPFALAATSSEGYVAARYRKVRTALGRLLNNAA